MLKISKIPKDIQRFNQKILGMNQVMVRPRLTHFKRSDNQMQQIYCKYQQIESTKQFDVVEIVNFRKQVQGHKIVINQDVDSNNVDTDDDGGSNQECGKNSSSNSIAIANQSNHEQINQIITCSQLPTKYSQINTHQPSQVQYSQWDNRHPFHIDSSSPINNSKYMPIKALNVFSRDWIIQAKISRKSEKRFTKNGGIVFKIEIIDCFGTIIECTFFNEAAKYYEQQLIEDKVYLFSNGQVKQSNKKFSTIKNDFCLIFELTAKIVESNDDGGIIDNSIEYNSDTIKSIESTDRNRAIDVCGVVIDVSDPEQVKLKNGNQKQRKYITIVDETMHSITITLWGEMSEKHAKLRFGDIIIAKRTKFSEFGGISLNAADDHSVILTNHIDDRTSALRKWFNEFSREPKCMEKVKSLTQKLGKQEEYKEMIQERMQQLEKKKDPPYNLVCEINDKLLEDSERFRRSNQDHIFYFNGYVLSITTDKVIYPACQVEQCKKKVTEELDGTFRCDNCKRNFQQYSPTYMVCARITDFTQSIFVNFTREHGNDLMGKILKSLFILRQE
ncbi:UNKNOWN [Stylonychia lemnae]|uniref:Uncharacterized protein n=1 Tax=Stylonychia lemnae TaxID=5949 RepID=A0A078A782_STYLE|nr:UNKNOWN [Stylonychia lemnae]|eukprot:CDW77382.1 UNKNOWN [Stylonychia lemnae]